MFPKRKGVVLIAPGDREEIYQSLGKSQSALEPPVWTGLLANFMRLKGFVVNVIDANAEGIPPSEVANRVKLMNPTLVAIICYGHQPNASTQVMPSAGRIARAIKTNDPEQYVVMAGGHVAALPERTLEEEEVDAVCTGEGPYTISDLLLALESGEKNLSKVRGLLYKNGDTLIKTVGAPIVRDLNEEMPGIAWDLLPMKLYRAHGWHCYGHPDKRQPYASLYSTLGCPFKCTFCPIQAPFREGEGVIGMSSVKNSYRYWSPEMIVSQLEFLVKEYGVYNVKFADEMFVLNKQHVLRMCELIIKRGLNLNIWAYVRIDTAGDDEQLEMLKRAGFRWLCFGIESGDSRVRNDVDKGFDQEKIFAVIKRVRDKGINVIGNYLFGLPEDDLDTMQRTLALATELNCEHANFYSAMAYPGSQLYNLAIEKGWPLPTSWSGFSQHSVDSTPLPTNHLTGAQVLEFRDYAWTTYFSNPRYHAMIEQKFGKPTADTIRKKASIKLERKQVRVVAP